MTEEKANLARVRGRSFSILVALAEALTAAGAANGQQTSEIGLAQPCGSL
jgi:hypothetical protein